MKCFAGLQDIEVAAAAAGSTVGGPSSYREKLYRLLPWKEMRGPSPLGLEKKIWDRAYNAANAGVAAARERLVGGDEENGD